MSNFNMPIVSGAKQISTGVLIDLNGHYPNEGMTLFVPKAAVRSFFTKNPGCAQLGSTVIVSGRQSNYKGRPEIVIADASQMKWHRIPVSSPPDSTTSEESAEQQEDPSASDFLIPLSTAEWITFIRAAVYIFTFPALRIKTVRCRQNPASSNDVVYVSTPSGMVRTQRRISVQNQLTQQTTAEYQKKLAMAYHLKIRGHAKAFNKLAPTEQVAAETLAHRYPLNPEVEAVILSGDI